MQLYKEPIFPTTLYFFNLPVEKVFLKAINNIKNKEKSVDRSNKGGYHSESNLHTRDIKCFDKLNNLILEVANNYIINDFSLTKDMSCKKVSEMWFIVNNKNDYNAIHTHARSWLSGAYYIKVPKKQKNFLVFEDPQPTRNFENLHYNNYGKEVTEGMLILFPGWLAHKVPVNTTEEERIVISFNLDYPTF